MLSLREIKNSILHLVFPHICSGCGTDQLTTGTMLCMRCMNSLPETAFEQHPGNPVEKMLWGRLPAVSASAQYYFNKESLMQHLMHQFKYKGDIALGMQLGRLMGEQLALSGRFATDILIPLPLFPDKERKRGFNQATVLCQGMAEVLGTPVNEKIIHRPLYTETQTRKGRVERWKNIAGKFELRKKEEIINKHLLLVDDVITTGATLDACGNELLKGNQTKVSIATLCIATR